VYEEGLGGGGGVVRRVGTWVGLGARGVGMGDGRRGEGEGGEVGER